MTTAVLAWDEVPEVRAWEAAAAGDDLDELLGAVVFGMATEAPPPGVTPERGGGEGGDLAKPPGAEAWGMAAIVLAVGAIVILAMVVGFAIGYALGCRYCKVM